MCMFRLKDLVRVLSNLFLNASQAMDNKGIITLTIQRLNKNSDNYVEIFVHDGGHGIPADKMETTFNPFFTTKEVGEGTGLGLTMVYNIIQNWGGHISVKSDKKNGTVFTVKLPISRN